MKLPHLLAGTHIEGLHIAGRGVLGRRLKAPVAHGRANGDHVATDHGRGRDSVVPAIPHAQWPTQRGPQIDMPTLAKSRVRDAGLGVNGIQMRGRGGQKYPLNFAIGPIAHPAQIAQEAEIHLPSLRVKGPQLLTALAIEGHENVEGRAIVEHAIHGERCAAVVVKAETAPHRIGTGCLVELLVGGPVTPDHAQLIEVVAMELVRRGVAGAAAVSSVVRPINLAGKRRRGERQRQQDPTGSFVHAFSSIVFLLPRLPHRIHRGPYAWRRCRSSPPSRKAFRPSGRRQ